MISHLTANMEFNRIIMFCDYGLDDAIATLHILGNAEMFEHIDIVPIGGNVPVETAYRNAQTLLVAAHADKNKVRIIDTRDVPQCAEDIPEVHGGDGMGDMLKPTVSDLTVVPFAEFAKELETQNQPDRDCVLSLGPCTLPAMLGYTPFCTILMGGTTVEPPNYGEYEFNEGADIAAFRKYAFTATAVATLDTCHDGKWDYEHIKYDGELAKKLARKYIDMCKARNAPIAVYDYIAAKAVTDPQLFEATRVRRADGVEYNELRRI